VPDAFVGLTIGSLFSGIGGLELGLEACGLGPVVWHADNDPFCRAVLRERWPHAIAFADVRAIDQHTPPVDVLCGGFPCQDLSFVGRGAGLNAHRSGLWWEFYRAADLLRPRFLLIENVGHAWARWVPVVRGSLWHLGYTSVPLFLSAAELGAFHRRQRCFVFALPIEDQARRSSHSNGESLRLQLPVGRWAAWQGPTVAPASGRARPSADPKRGLPNGWGADTSGTRWHPQPSLAGGPHGLPNRVDRARERALGNAAVPAAAAAAWVAGIRFFFDQEAVVAQ